MDYSFAFSGDENGGYSSKIIQLNIKLKKNHPKYEVNNIGQFLNPLQIENK